MQKSLGRYSQKVGTQATASGHEEPGYNKFVPFTSERDHLGRLKPSSHCKQSGQQDLMKTQRECSTSVVNTQPDSSNPNLNVSYHVKSKDQTQISQFSPIQQQFLKFNEHLGNLSKESSIGTHNFKNNRNLISLHSHHMENEPLNWKLRAGYTNEGTQYPSSNSALQNSSKASGVKLLAHQQLVETPDRTSGLSKKQLKKKASGKRFKSINNSRKGLRVKPSHQDLIKQNFT